MATSARAPPACLPATAKEVIEWSAPLLVLQNILNGFKPEQLDIIRKLLNFAEDPHDLMISAFPGFGKTAPPLNYPLVRAIMHDSRKLPQSPCTVLFTVPFTALAVDVSRGVRSVKEALCNHAARLNVMNDRLVAMRQAMLSPGQSTLIQEIGGRIRILQLSTLDETSVDVASLLKQEILMERENPNAITYGMYF